MKLFLKGYFILDLRFIMFETMRRECTDDNEIYECHGEKVKSK